jgi:hypothetical protein
VAVDGAIGDGNVAGLALGEVVEVVAGIEAEGAVIIIGDGAAARLAEKLVGEGALIVVAVDVVGDEGCLQRGCCLGRLHAGIGMSVDLKRDRGRDRLVVAALQPDGDELRILCAGGVADDHAVGLPRPRRVAGDRRR